MFGWWDKSRSAGGGGVHVHYGPGVGRHQTDLRGEKQEKREARPIRPPPPPGSATVKQQPVNTHKIMNQNTNIKNNNNESTVRYARLRYRTINTVPVFNACCNAIRKLQYKKVQVSCVCVRRVLIHTRTRTHAHTQFISGFTPVACFLEVIALCSTFIKSVSISIFTHLLKYLTSRNNGY